MLNNLLKTITVLALTIGGSVVAMQQQQKPAAARAQRPQMVCRGGVCRLVQPQTAIPTGCGVAAPAAVARGGVATPTAQGRYTIGVTPAQQASQKEQFAKMIEAQKAKASAAQQGFQPIPVPGAQAPTQAPASSGFQAIPVPR